MERISIQEQKNKRIALLTTIGIHILLFFAFLFAVAWRAPDPPLPEYGIELNFGMDTEGSGDVQPETPVGTEQQSDSDKQEVQNDVPKEETQAETAQPKPQEAQPVEQEVTTRQESPVTVKEQKKDEVKPVEKPKEKPAEKPVENKQPTKDPDASYNPSTAKNTADKTQTKSGQPGSQGDDANKTGDKGDPKGSVDADALYGNAGGGKGGSSLNMAGWVWDEIPRPDVPDNESGRIVFEIKVDSNGDIISIITKERGGVSLEAEKICRKAIERLTFSKTGGTAAPEVTKGEITFLIRSN